MIKKIKNIVLWLNLISALNGEKIVRKFLGKRTPKKVKESLELKELSTEKVIKYILNGKATIILAIVGLIKNII